MADRGIEYWDREEFDGIVARWPKAVRTRIPDALRSIQNGDPPNMYAKPLKGFDIPLWELKHRSGARVVYTVAFVDRTGNINILDAFNKDASEDSKMRKKDKKRIEGRVADVVARVKAMKRGLH